MFTGLGARMPGLKTGLFWQLIVALVLGTVLAFTFRLSILLCESVIKAMESGVAEICASNRGDTLLQAAVLTF